MKKILFLAIAIFAVSELSGQIEMSNGKIGIGTTMPKAAVHIKGSDFQLTDANDSTRLSMTADGLGIGTLNPEATLDLDGSFRLPRHASGVNDVRLNRSNRHVYRILMVDTSGLVVCRRPLPRDRVSAIEESESLKKLQKSNANLIETISDLEKRLIQLTKNIDDLERFTKNIVLTDNRSLSRLGQNAPNPTANAAVIEYSIIAEAKKAIIRFYNTSGQIIREESIINRGSGQIRLDVSDLPNGSYMYSLIVDGRLIDTKTMIISK